MSSNARKGSPPRSSSKGVTTLASAKARVFVFLTLMILTAVVSASALAANQTAAPATAQTQEAGFFASSFNNILSFFGLAEAAPAKDDNARGCDTAPEGLIACYRADNDASDSRGVHNGDWVGTYGYATGKVGAGAFNFSGRGTVEVADAADLNPSKITVDGWVNLSSTEGDFALISKGEAFSLRVRNGQVVFTSRNAEGVIETLESRGTIGTGKWVHLAATNDGELTRLYIDGEEANSIRTKGLTKAEGSNVIIGAVASNENNFTVSADEVKLFGRALTAKEIREIAGNAPDAPQDITGYSASPGTIPETGGTTTITVTRGNVAANVTTVTFTQTAGSAATLGACSTPGVDYELSQNFVVFGAGDTNPKTILASACPDTLAEGNEIAQLDATVVGDNPAGLAVAAVNFTITDDDFFTAGPAIQTTEGIPGGAGALTYSVTRTTGVVPAGQPAVTVNFTMTGTAQFSADTATSRRDYTVPAANTCGGLVTFNDVTGLGTFTFPAGNTNATCGMTVSAIADDFVENNETAIFTLTTQPGVPAAQTGTINNDDNPHISVAVSAAQNSGGNQYVEEGTPQTGAAAGQLTYTFTRGLCAAAIPGDPGNVGAAPLCPGGDSSALVQQDVNLTFSGTARRSGGTAADPDDYTPAGTQTYTAATGVGSIRFAGTNVAAVVAVDPNNDITVENDESVVVTINAGAGYNVDTTPAGVDTATGFINDDDEDVSVTAANTPLSEAGPGAIAYTFTRTALSGANPVAINGIDPRADAIVVNFTLGGAATQATCSDTSDYTLSAGAGATAVFQGNCAAVNSTVSIAGAVNSAVVNATPTNDGVPENNENVLFSIVANGTQYGVGSPNDTATNATANGVIVNDDFQVIVRVSPSQVVEGSPSAPDASLLTYTFTRIGETTAVICANFNVSGSAEATTDYTTAFNTPGGGACVSSFTPVGGAGPSPGRTAINGGAGAPATEGGVQANQATFTISPTDDSLVEADELAIVQVDNHTGIGPLYSPGNPAQATGTILNDDAEVSVAVAPSAVLEDGATNLVYTFSRTGGCGAGLTVNFTNGGGTATQGTDYTGVANGATTATFAAGQCTTTVTVDPTTDATVEPDETVIFTLNAGTGYTVAAAPANAATGTIQNDDSGVSVTVAPAAVNEDSGTNLVYTFTRTGVTNTPLTVNYTVGGTATNGTDYAAIGTSVPFAVNQTTATVNVTPTADTVVEPDETVIITVVDGTGYSATAPTQATGTITNDDTDIVCTGPAPSSVNENSGTAMVYTCTRTGVTASALSVQFALSGTATFTTDYAVGGNTSGVSAAGGTLNFGAGSATATVTATPVADLTVEPDETVIVTFTNPGVYSGYDFVPSPTVLTGTITNDDTDVSVTVAPGAVAEDGAPNLVYTFTRNTSAALLALPLTVNFSTTGTATSGTDYTQTATGTITFAANSTTATLTVDPTPDTVVEPDETVIITITAGTGYTAVNPTSATGTITNDDTSYTIVFSGVTGAASGPGNEGNPGDPGDTIATFTITRNGQNSPAGSVSVSTIPGSGTATAGAPNTVCQPGQDYTSDGQTLVFAAAAPGETSISQTFTVRICRDLAFELTETFDAQLSNPTGGFPGAFLGTPGPVATATIVDDDNPPVLTVANVTVNENAGTATLTVTQSVATGVNTTFNYTTGAAGDTATAGADYTTTTGSGTIAAGATTATVTVPIIDDNFDEPNETFAFRLTSATNATISPAPPATTATVTIVDNEPSTLFAINDVAQIEGNPSVNDPSVASTSAFNFRITRTGDAQASETVCFETVNGDIENPAINPNPATAGPNDASALTGASDYTPRVAGPTNCVTFTQGGPSVITVPVIVYGDAIFEFDEYFTVRIVSVNGVANPLNESNQPRITDRLGLGTIQNDDLVSQYSIAQITPVGNVIEGNSGQQNVTYRVTRTQTAVAGTVDYATAPSGSNPATAGTTCGFPVDYLTRTGTLTFAAGVATQDFTVPVCGDTVDENNETFTVTLSNPTFGSIGTGSVTTTIQDDDAAPIITVSDVSACEVNAPDTQAFVFTITRAGASALTSTVTVNTVSGTAVSPGDFVAITGQVVTFAPGETTKTVTVTVNGDNVFETDESFTLQVVAASSDVVTDPAGGADPIGLGIIQNVCAGGDPAPSFGLGAVTQAEGTLPDGSQNPFFVRLTRTGATEVPGTLTFGTAGISGQATGGAACAPGVDYITQAGTTVNFPAGGFTPLTTGGVFGGAQGANFVDIPVQVCRDALFEPNETLNATIAAVSFAQVAAGGSPALVTITNDDGLTFSIRFPGPASAEGNVGTTAFTFTIDRTGDSSVTSTVCYETVNGTAQAPSDYTALPATTCSTFSAGVNSVNVPVLVNGDTVGEADETFFLRLVSSSAVGSTIDPAQRLATILNDDGPPPPPTGVEGDIVDGAGGAAGDGLVQANDVTAIRNAVLGTLTLVTTPNQFQRADTNVPCGNGGIDAGDVSVIRGMVLGTIPNNTPACGPTQPGGPGNIEADRADIARVIRAVNVNASTSNTAQTVTVAFQLDSQGDENALSFTANWPAALTFVSAAAGNGLPAGANFNTNTSQTGQGRLGILIDANPGTTFAAGTRQIATITFTIPANTPAGVYPITFSSNPTVQSTAGTTGALLQTAYEQGNVTLVLTAAGVRVSGRVTTANGQGLRNATVVLTDAQGNRRTATTGSFGIYTFEDVEAGETYVVGVQAKRYRFASRIVNVTDSLTDVNFVGQE